MEASVARFQWGSICSSFLPFFLSFIWQTIPEHLLCIRYGTRHLGYPKGRPGSQQRAFQITVANIYHTLTMCAKNYTECFPWLISLKPHSRADGEVCTDGESWDSDSTNLFQVTSSESKFEKSRWGQTPKALLLLCGCLLLGEVRCSPQSNSDPPTACFYITWELRVAFTFLNGWKNQKKTTSWSAKII